MKPTNNKQQIQNIADMKRLAFCIIALLVLSCGTSRKVGELSKPADTAAEIFSVGRGESLDLNTAKMFAHNAARGELSVKIRSRVKTFTESYSSQHKYTTKRNRTRDGFETLSETYTGTSADNIFTAEEVSHKVRRNPHTGVYTYEVCLRVRKAVATEQIIASGDVDTNSREIIKNHKKEFVESQW